MLKVTKYFTARPTQSTQHRPLWQGQVGMAITHLQILPLYCWAALQHCTQPLAATNNSVSAVEYCTPQATRTRHTTLSAPSSTHASKCIMMIQKLLSSALVHSNCCKSGTSATTMLPYFKKLAVMGSTPHVACQDANAQQPPAAVCCEGLLQAQPKLCHITSTRYVTSCVKNLPPITESLRSLSCCERFKCDPCLADNVTAPQGGPAGVASANGPRFRYKNRANLAGTPVSDPNF